MLTGNTSSTSASVTFQAFLSTLNTLVPCEPSDNMTSDSFGAAVTNDHNLGALKNQNAFFATSGDWKSQIKVLQGAPSGGPRGEYVLASVQFW